MANENNSSPQKVNPFLLVILGLTIVGAAFYLWSNNKHENVPTASAPTTAPAPADQSNSTPNTQSQPSAVVAGNGTQVVDNTIANGNSGANKDDKSVINTMSIKRNPFLTPSIYLKTTISNSPTIVPTAKDTPTKAPDIIIPKGSDLRLGAVCQNKGDKVAIIYSEGKGYILRENGVVKGTDYRVKSIDEHSVVLQKENGEEKVLKIEDKALKLKGGEH